MITLRFSNILTRSRCLSLIALALLASSTLTLSAATRPRTVLYVAKGTFGVEGTLYTVDKTTGAVLSTVGPLDDAAGNPYAMGGMKYNPFDGILYGTTMSDSPTNPSR